MNYPRLLEKKIIVKLEWVQKNFEAITPLSLGGKWQGFFKLRIGDWRVIYKIDWKVFEIIVVAIGHRSDVYKKQQGV